MTKTSSIEQAVAEIESGMTIGVGGWGARRKPMALVRAICRSPVEDLTVVSFGGPDVGLLAAAGKLRKLVFGFVSPDVAPLDPHFRAVREAGAIESAELDEGMLQWGLYAAALRLPFLPTRAGLATDVMRVNPELRTIDSPYGDGERLVAMPALRLDVALIHVNRADARGNGQILGPDPYFDDLYAGAADRCVMSCERVVDTAELRGGGCLHTLAINRSMVHRVVEAPYGAHPTACDPDYGLDADHLLDRYATAADPAGWSAYAAEFVSAGDQSQYIDRAGGEGRLAALAPTVI